MMHNASYDAAHRKGLKMLTLKQKLQILPIVLAQKKQVIHLKTY